MAKHYIRLDNNKSIIKIFSDELEKPEQEDIFYKDGGLHFNDIDGEPIYGGLPVPKFKYVSGKIKKRTVTELKADSYYIYAEYESKIKEKLREIAISEIDKG